MISAPPACHGHTGGASLDGRDRNDGEDIKSVVCIPDEGDIICYNIMELVLGKDNYDVMLSALCSVKNTTLRNKGLAAFFAKNKSFRSIECQTDNFVNTDTDQPPTVSSNGENDRISEEVHQVVSPAQSVSPETSQSDRDVVALPPVVAVSTEAVPMSPHPHVVTVVSTPSPVAVAAPSAAVVCSGVSVSTLPSDNKPRPMAGAKIILSKSPIIIGNKSILKVLPTTSGVTRVSPSNQHNIRSPASSVVPPTPVTVHRPPTEPSSPFSRVIKVTSRRISFEPTTSAPSSESLPGGSIGGTPSAPLPAETPDTARPFDLDKELEYDARGLLQIHRAVIDQDTDSVWMCGENLKRLGYNVDQRTKPEGYTALQLALVRGCNFSLIRVLLWLGADPLARDARGRPTLLLALLPANRTQSNGSLRPSAGHLLRLLSSTYPKVFEEACAQTDNQGLTVLMHCAIKSWVDAMRLVLLHMPSRLVDVQLPASGMTALHMAMLAYSTALDNALSTEWPLRCIQLLQRAGASDNIPDIEGVTAAQLARTPMLNVNNRRSNKKVKRAFNKTTNDLSSYATLSTLIHHPYTNHRKTKYIKVDLGTPSDEVSDKSQNNYNYGEQRKAAVRVKSRGKMNSSSVSRIKQNGATCKVNRHMQNKNLFNSNTVSGCLKSATKYPLESVVIYHNNVKLRRSLTEVLKDKSLQPVIRLHPIRNDKQSLKCKSSKIKVKHLGQLQYDSSGKSTSEPQRIEPAELLTTCAMGNNIRQPDQQPLSENIMHRQSIRVSPNNNSAAVSHNQQHATLLHKRFSPSSGSSSVAVSPKKTWISRSNKKNQVSAVKNKKRRCSLESIANDVEIIKQAIAMQDQHQQMSLSNQ